MRKRSKIRLRKETKLSAEQKLRDLGIELPAAPRPVAAYIPMKQIGDLVFVSGQGPTKAGAPVIAGKVGGDLTIDEGFQAARLAVLNSLAILKEGLGSLDKVREIVHVRGFVNSAPGFDQQPRVMNGASELLEEVFGEAGKHARAALGASDLPSGIAVEVELVVSV